MATITGGSGDDSLTGTDDADSITGAGGNDTLRGGKERDTISGGAGNDSIEGGDKEDLIYGGDGNDTIRGDGSAGSHADTIYGGAGADVVYGGGGDDSIFGEAGSDTIYGDAGNDTISGGDDADFIDGGVGDDSLSGDDGDDTIRGGDGKDRISGGAGADSIEGGIGDDTIFGDVGDDTIRGGAGDDNISGGAGNDSLDGGAGADSISGGDGNDTIISSGGKDTLSGGADADTFVFTGHDEDVVVTGGGTVTTGADFDTIDLSALSGPVNVTYTGDKAGQITDGSGKTITFSGIEKIILTQFNDTVNGAADGAGMAIDALGGNDSVIGGAGNDTLDGGDGSDTLLGGAGNDRLLGGEGADSLSGDAGNDTLDGGGGNDSLFGGAGNDSILGGAGNDIISVGSSESDTGTDTVYAGSGDDIVLGDAGNDLIFGEGGNDQIEGRDGADTIDGGDGDDLIIGYDAVSTMTWDFSVQSDDGSADSLSGGAGNDIILGGAGDDTLDGGADADTLVGGSGNDSILGGTGTDTIDGGDGADTIDGGADADTIDGGADADLIMGGSGTDSISGGTGDDTIDGGTDADTIDGGLGNDSIEGGAGNDSLSGGDADSGPAGRVAFKWSDIPDPDDGGQIDDNDVLTNGSQAVGPVNVGYTFSNSNAEYQTAAVATQGIDGDGTANPNSAISFEDSVEVAIVFSQEVNNVSFRLSDLDDQPDSFVIRAFDANGNQIPFTATNGANVTSSDSDTVAGDDTFGAPTTTFVSDTDLGSSVLIEIPGPVARIEMEFISPSDGTAVGSDIYFDDPTPATGTGGDDTLSGGDGDDIIDGRDGDDSLTGGDGNDTFIYAPGDGNDTITDFNFGNSGTLGDIDTTNNDFIDLGAYYDSLNELRADQADDGVLNQSNTVDDKGRATDYSDNTQFGGGSITMQGATSESYTADNTGVVCFTSGTAILTPKGDVLIDDLNVGDFVTTMDNGPQRIAWIGQRHVPHSELSQNDRLHPVLIKKGVLGADRDLLVSRQHGMLLGQDHFARAVHLAKTMPGIRIAAGKRQVTYVHLMFEAHQVIFAQGIPSESFYPGLMALELLSNASKGELIIKFPTLKTAQRHGDILLTYGDVARVFLENKKAVDTLLRERPGSVENQILKWDADLAMERFELEQMLETTSAEQICKEISRMA